jgi:hypothetical protein
MPSIKSMVHRQRTLKEKTMPSWSTKHQCVCMAATVKRLRRWSVARIRPARCNTLRLALEEHFYFGTDEGTLEEAVFLGLFEATWIKRWLQRCTPNHSCRVWDRCHVPRPRIKGREREWIDAIHFWSWSCSQLPIFILEKKWVQWGGAHRIFIKEKGEKLEFAPDRIRTLVAGCATACPATGLQPNSQLLAILKYLGLLIPLILGLFHTYLDLFGLTNTFNSKRYIWAY